MHQTSGRVRLVSPLTRCFGTVLSSQASCLSSQRPASASTDLAAASARVPCRRPASLERVAAWPDRDPFRGSHAIYEPPNHIRDAAVVHAHSIRICRVFPSATGPQPTHVGPQRELVVARPKKNPPLRPSSSPQFGRSRGRRGLLQPRYSSDAPAVNNRNHPTTTPSRRKIARLPPASDTLRHWIGAAVGQRTRRRAQKDGVAGVLRVHRTKLQTRVGCAQHQSGGSP